MLSQVHVFVKGDIIGVGFRAWTKIQARIHGVSGWVRNVYDDPHRFGPQGGVEAVLQGDKDKIEQLVAILHKGSAVSRVEEVEVIPQDAKEIIEGFEIRK